uniref:SGNH hydrolase-type esterase domain-containing protein n=1 Tax=Desulfomonile tiedjei TaxID=2358 RepID=A0A7C4AT85_9BACT
MKRTLKIVAINVCVTVVLVAILGLAGEWYLRTYAPLSDHRGLFRLTHDPAWYAMIPNSDVVKQGVRITTNSDGYRDREFVDPSSSGKFVIAVLGDSFTFAQGVPQDATYPAIMERVLNQKVGKDYFRVWNLGVSGYNTEQESYILKTFVAPRRPSWVVVGYNINDYEPVNIPPTGPPGHIQESPQQLERQKNFLDADLLVIHFVKHRLGDLIRKVRPGWYHSSYVSDIKKAYLDPHGPWQKVAETLKSMNQLCKAEGMGFTVALLPAMFDFTRYEFSDVHEIVQAFCEKNEIDVVDVAPFFQGMHASHLQVSLMDPHPNAAAQAIFANAIAEHLLRVIHKTSQSPRAGDSGDKTAH